MRIYTVLVFSSEQSGCCPRTARQLILACDGGIKQSRRHHIKVLPNVYNSFDNSRSLRFSLFFLDLTTFCLSYIPYALCILDFILTYILRCTLNYCSTSISCPVPGHSSPGILRTFAGRTRQHSCRWIVERILCDATRMASFQTSSGIHMIPHLAVENQAALSERINASTRTTHTQLNRLITARLPLALPPYATDSSAYIVGLLHVAPIYITFESLWQSVILDSQTPTIIGSEARTDACQSRTSQTDARLIFSSLGTGKHVDCRQVGVSDRIRAILTHLHLPSLLRAHRLQADILASSRETEGSIHCRLEELSQNGKLAEFVAHTTKSIESNPHVLLAYAWVFYMALFAGGRHLRAILQNAGPHFWSSSSSLSVVNESLQQSKIHKDRRTDRGQKSNSVFETVHSRPEIRNILQFFHFPGEEDGEDIKREFKMRFADVENSLSETEKLNVIEEAQAIFMFMIGVVGDLDALFGTASIEVEQATKKATRKSTKDCNRVVTAEDNVYKEMDHDCNSVDGRQQRTKTELLKFAESLLLHLQTIGYNLWTKSAPLTISSETILSRSRPDDSYFTRLDGPLAGGSWIGFALALLVTSFAWYFSRTINKIPIE